MTRLLSALLICILLAASAFSQETAPKPSATPPSEETDVVKISTNLIQIDVTVTDKKGKIVSDLKPEEIEIYENGQKQQISNFSFISSVKEQPILQTVSKEKTPVPIPPTAVRPENVHRTIALVVDDLTLSFQSTYYVRRALKKFVDEQMQEGDLVAIIRTGAGIGALQQFTNDKRQLLAAIEKVRWNMNGAGGIGAFAPIEATPLERAKSAGADISDEQIKSERGFLRGDSDFREDIFASGTLGAINFIVRGMRDLPGRKSVMLLSDGFSLYSKTGEFSESTRVLELLRRLVDLANRASVVVYTMDARGLQLTGLTAADDLSGLTSDTIEQRISDRRSKLFDTQAGLQYLAEQTGGIAIINNNDLSWGIRKILDDQSYYLIGYQPDDETFDPKTRRFNKLEIKVKRSGTKVRYRSGFFGVTDEVYDKSRTNLSASRRIINALTSPFAVNDVSLRLNALFGKSPTAGSFIQSFVHIETKDFKFIDQPDGSKKAVFDIMGVAFGDNGIFVDQTNKTFTMTVKNEADFREVSRDGIVLDFMFPIKKPGAYQLRVAILDRASEKVGSANQFIEVPNLKKHRLTLSGIVPENIPFDEWQKLAKGEKFQEGAVQRNPAMDIALRRFKRGTVLNFASEAFNAKLDNTQKPNLTFQTRIFREGQMIFEGKPLPVVSAQQVDLGKTIVAGSISLGTDMLPGDYVLQIIVTDNLAKEKRKLATQFLQFEIIE